MLNPELVAMVTILLHSTAPTPPLRYHRTDGNKTNIPMKRDPAPDKEDSDVIFFFMSRNVFFQIVHMYKRTSESFITFFILFFLFHYKHRGLKIIYR